MFDSRTDAERLRDRKIKSVTTVASSATSGPANYVQETYDKMARRNACLDGKHEVEMAVDVSADFYERGNHDRKRDIFVCTHCRNLYVPRT